jgi:tRNA nucleotidyltransferase/poly(A) polymerase
MADTLQRELAMEITRQLRDAGFQALWAGGCVRDQLLGLVPKDYDVATNARPEQVQELFGKRRTLAIGASFGVIAVLKKGCLPVEVATFRSDGAYIDGRRPTTVQYTTAEQDSQRRDFTINGMFYDPLANEVIDYVGGQKDLENRVVRAIGDPRARFAEDKLRMLRAVRFATTLEFELDRATLAAVQEMAAEITVISAERIGAELTRLLVHPRRSQGIKLLHSAGLLGVLLPELADDAAKDSEVWQKTLTVLASLESRELGTTFAALLGERDEQVNIAEVGRRFRFANSDIELANWLRKNLPNVAKADALPWPQLQRILVHENSAELLSLGRVSLGRDHQGVRHCEKCLQLPPEKLNPVPLLTGDDLVRQGHQPGPYFAKVLNAVRDSQLEGEVINQTEALVLAEQLIRGEKHS